MNELLLFYLPACPHCKLAMRAMEQLRRENPAYAAIQVTMIDESKEKALSDSYDYWYVPSYFLNGKKIHEGHAESSDVRRVFDAALAANKD